MNPIDEIKQRIDIVDLIGQQVALRRSGRSLLGFCPFHENTRTPAFVVYPDTQSFYCFGCGASGTVFDYVMRQQGVDFAEALHLLAAQAGVTLRAPSAEEEAQDQQRTRLAEINTLTARYFHYIAQQHRRGQPGRDYIAKRGIAPEIAEQFQLGYSLNESAHLLHYLTNQKGYDPADLLAAGVIAQHPERGFYDRFRGRVMFPIRTANGQVIGFGGRALGDAQPKYLNTPQTALFDKSQTLYGLDLARDAIRQADACIIVEGYVDVITAHQYGFRNVVAPLGTALTAGHVALIRKLSHNVYLALDADAAGQRATLRGLQALRSDAPASDAMQPVVGENGLVHFANDLNLHIIQMPAGNDPDDLIRSDPQQWHTLVQAALPVMDFYIQYHTAGLDLHRPQDRRVALERLLPLLAELDGTQQRVYVASLEDTIGMRAELLIDMINEHRHAQRSSSQRTPRRRSGAAGTTNSSTPTTAAGAKATREDNLLALLLRYPQAHSTIHQWLARDLEAHRKLGDLLGVEAVWLFEATANRMLYQQWQQAGMPPLPSDDELRSTPPAWVQQLDPHLHEHLLYLAGLALPDSREYLFMREIETCVVYIRRSQVRRWRERLGQQAHDHDAHDPADPDSATSTLDQPAMLDLLGALMNYESRISMPPRNGTYFELRDILES